MNRRAVLTTTSGVVLSVLAYRGLPTSARQAIPGASPAASPAASPEATPQGGYELLYEGQVVKAVRDFEADGLRMGALFFTVIVAVFDSEKHAEDGFETAAEIVDELLENIREGGVALEVVGRSEISAPEVGAKRYAETVDLVLDGTDAVMSVIRAQEGEVLHVWSALGLGSPTQELLALADEHMAFGEVDADDDAALLDLIPDLTDLPAGFAETGETVTREDS